MISVLIKTAFDSRTQCYWRWIKVAYLGSGDMVGWKGFGNSRQSSPHPRWHVVREPTIENKWFSSLQMSVRLITLMWRSSRKVHIPWNKSKAVKIIQTRKNNFVRDETTEIDIWTERQRPTTDWNHNSKTLNECLRITKTNRPDKKLVLENGKTVEYLVTHERSREANLHPFLHTKNGI